MRITFEKIGADPEWRSVIPRGERFMTSTLLFPQGGGGNTFIGLDGNGVTGELRPPPSPDVRRVLAYVARGLILIDEALARWVPKPRLHAAPVVDSYTLGGHEHISFTAPASAMSVAKMESVWEALTYLQGPLETWVQPTELHRQRRNSYGGRYDIRNNTVKQPRSPGRHRFWYEYRTPSTWLAHPAIAYLYLAMAKLTMLNLGDAYCLATQEGTNLFRPDQATSPSYMELVDRLSKTSTWRRTRDLLLIPEALDVASLLVEGGYGPEVNTEAWRELDVCPRAPLAHLNEDTEQDAGLEVPERLHVLPGTNTDNSATTTMTPNVFTPSPPTEEDPTDVDDSIDEDNDSIEDGCNCAICRRDREVAAGEEDE